MEPPLTELGIEQAQMAAQFLKDRNIQVVVSSRMNRTRQTARIIANHLGIEEVDIVEDLQEQDVGRFSGWLHSEVERERRENEAAVLKEIEDDTDFGLRVANSFREIGSRYPDKTVLAVTHSGSIRSVVRYLGERACVVENLQGYIFYCKNESEQVTIGDRILPPRPPDPDSDRPRGSGGGTAGPGSGRDGGNASTRV